MEIDGVDCARQTTHPTDVRSAPTPKQYNTNATPSMILQHSYIIRTFNTSDISLQKTFIFVIY